MLEREMPGSLDDAVPQRLFGLIHLALVVAATAAGRRHSHNLLNTLGKAQTTWFQSLKDYGTDQRESWSRSICASTGFR